MKSFVRGIFILLIILTFSNCQIKEDGNKNVWTIAKQRASIYEDCGKNAIRLLQGWIDLKQDPDTKLFPKEGVWDYHDKAADHYSSLVLVAFYVSPEMVEKNGILHQTLMNYQDLCSTPSGIPALYDLKDMSKGSEAQLGHLAEWLRDGLIRIVEIMGIHNDWYEEMKRLTDVIIIEAEKRGGMNKAFGGSEDSGTMLQTLTRLYAMSGEERYLKATESLADAILLDSETIINLPQRNKNFFSDHGCELIPGLGELFVLECQLGSSKVQEYEGSLLELLDGILESYCNPSTGFLCSFDEGENGGKRWNRPPDTWGYVLFTYENYDRGTGAERYTKVIEKPMRWLIENRFDFENLKRNGLWPYYEDLNRKESWRQRSSSMSADDWSDSYESMIVFWNRYPSIDGVFDWLNWSTLQGFHRECTVNGMEKYGPYTGGHFDGSTGRTLCIHMMLCSQGVRTVPFIEGLRLGGVQKNDILHLSLESDQKWNGRLCFDSPRTECKTATINWARINEMPQWFIARPGQKYSISVSGSKPRVLDGQELINGIEMGIKPGQIKFIQIREASQAY